MAQACDETKLYASRYIKQRKDLLGLANQLHSIGAQDVIDVPRITVIGKQSAGKSSVVEAISGITVPRDAGTCTRCPLECRLQSTPPDSPWSCKVSLRKETSVNGVQSREPEVQFGPIINDKSKVEGTLRRAQFACLNPNRPIDQVLAMTEEELKADMAPKTTINGTSSRGAGRKVGFSRNVVCVDIQGPGLPDLSFIDLPGLIQNAEPEDVQLVEDLVMSNIQGNCLILVTMPVTDDIENQKALRLAQRVDPSGRRTIGVLTKPDLLPPTSTSARQMWLDIIEGRKHSLKHGYYCVRQPDDSEREAGITRSEARDAEDKFFDTHEVWKNVNGVTKRRLGTDRLIDTVGELLVHVINESLPRIRAEAAENLEACRRELHALPPVLDTDPSTYMLTMLTSLSNDVLEYVRGGPDNSRLIHGNREAFLAFKMKIRGTCPQFVAKSTTGNRATRANNLEALIWNCEAFNLRDMKEHIERSVTRELRGNVPYQAKVSLITASQKHWPTHMLECYNRVRTSLAAILYECVQRNFQQHEKVLGPIKAYIDELIDIQYDKCLEFLEASLETERTPFTQNDHYLDSSNEKWLAKYREERAESKKNPTISTTSSATTSKNEGPVPDFFSTRPASSTTSTTATATYDTSTPATTNGSGSFKAKPSSSTLFAGFARTPSNGTATDNPFQPQPKPSTSAPFGFSTAASASPFGQFSTSSNGSASASAAKKPQEKPQTNDSTSNGTSSSASFKPAAAEGTSTTTGQIFTSKPFWETPTAQKSSEGFGFQPSPSTTPKPPSATLQNDQGFGFLKDQAKVQEALALLASIGYAGLTEEDLGKLNPADEYETELKVMAEVRGYFQVSYKRVIDNIPSLIDLKFVRAVGKELQPFLISKFELGTTNGNHRCAVYLAEDLDVAERREQLLARKKRLESVQAELFNFGM